MDVSDIKYMTNRSKIIDCGITEDAFYRTPIQRLAGVRSQMEQQQLLDKEQRIKENPSLGY